MQGPEEYDEAKAGFYKTFTDFVPILLNKLKWENEEKVLDYGCGPGSLYSKYLAPIVAKHNSKYIGVDVSEQMVKCANTNNAGHGDPIFILGNIMDEEFPVSKASVNKIIAVYVLDWFDDYRVPMERLAELLVPGGQMGIISGSKLSAEKFLEALADDPQWSKYMEGYEKPELGKPEEKAEDVQAALTQCFESLDVTVEEFQMIRELENIIFDDIVGLYISLNPYLDKIPTSLRHELQESYKKLFKIFLNIPADVEGKDEIQFENFVFLAILKKN